MMFVGTQQNQKKLNTRKRKGQDATKITSVPAELLHPISLVSGAGFDDNTYMDGEKHFNRGDR